MKNQIFVGADNEGGGLMAARHLMEKPRRAVGIIGGSVNSESLVSRMKGYRKGLKEAGLEDDHIHFYAGEFSQESGYENTLRILKEHPETNGLICLNDLVALGALKAARESNRQYPQDIGIIGYDDTYLASLEPISLTSVYQPKYQMGYRAMSRLLARLQSGGTVSSESCEILPCSLSKRNSV
jgi:LacI family transcriptional regulator